MPRHRIALSAAALIVIGASFLPFVPASPIEARAVDAAGISSGPHASALDRLPNGARPISLDIRDLPVTDLPDLLRKLGLEVEIAGPLPERTIDIHAENEPLKRVLARVAVAASVRFEVTDTGALRIGGPVLLAGVGDVTHPRLIAATKVEPVYPESAARDGLEGTVILQAMIDESGAVVDIEPLRARPENQDFIDAAVDAVRQWRYEPATRDGVAVPVYFTVFIEFRLGDEPRAPV